MKYFEAVYIYRPCDMNRSSDPDPGFFLLRLTQLNEHYQ